MPLQRSRGHAHAAINQTRDSEQLDLETEEDTRFAYLNSGHFKLSFNASLD